MAIKNCETRKLPQRRTKLKNLRTMARKLYEVERQRIFLFSSLISVFKEAGTENDTVPPIEFRQNLKSQFFAIKQNIYFSIK